jgi:hypothetical protein
VVGVRARVALATREFGEMLRSLAPTFDDGTYGTVARYLYLSQLGKGMQGGRPGSQCGYSEVGYSVKMSPGPLACTTSLRIPVT